MRRSVRPSSRRSTRRHGRALSDLRHARQPNLEPRSRREPQLRDRCEMGDRSTPAQLTGAMFRTEKFNARTRTTTRRRVHARRRAAGHGCRARPERQSDRALVRLCRLRVSWTASSSQSAQPRRAGAELVFTPENTFNLWTTYVCRCGLELGVACQFMDCVFRNATSTARCRATGCSMRWPTYPVTDTLTLRLNASNLADEEYIDRVGGGHFIPGPGRRLRSRRS